jgi:prophage regulatory protein
MTTFLRLPQVINRTGLKRSSIYAAMQAGTFPAQIPLGERAVGWKESDVDKWINDRIKAAENSREVAA